MVKFDSNDPGTASSEWLADARWPAVPRLPLEGDWEGETGLLVLAAHPDDETLGAGGLMALARSARIPVSVVVVTGRDPVRSAEVRDALDVLGVDDLRLLGFADGAVREERSAVADAVSGIVREHPGTLVVAPWSGDGHRDHRVLGEISREVSRSWGHGLWSYPIWLWHWGSPGHMDVPWARFGAVSLPADVRALKAEALACFPSQTDGPRPMLHARFLENFDRAEEVFVVEAPTSRGTAL